MNRPGAGAARLARLDLDNVRSRIGLRVLFIFRFSLRKTLSGLSFQSKSQEKRRLSGPRSGGRQVYKYRDFYGRMKMFNVLAVNIAGYPVRWLDAQRAACYVASGKVAWELGEEMLVLRGGRQRNGKRSTLGVKPVIALAKSEAMVRYTRASLPLGHDNTLLFKRDHYLCAYCGEKFPASLLTREHVFPRARGGRDEWENLVTACRACNVRKACRTPEEAGMRLLYVPYMPCRFEHFLLSGRHIVADQMAYLSAHLSRRRREN